MAKISLSNESKSKVSLSNEAKSTSRTFSQQTHPFKKAKYKFKQPELVLDNESKPTKVSLSNESK